MTEAVAGAASRVRLPSRFGRNTASNYMVALTSLLVALLGTPVLVRGLSREEYGVWVIVGSVVLYLELLELGVGAANIRYIASAYSRGDLARVRSTIATSVWLLSVPGLLVVVGAVLLAIVFPVLFSLSGSVVNATRVVLVLLAIDLGLSIPLDTFGCTLAAIQRYDLLNVTLSATLFAQALGWVVVIALGGHLVAIGAVTATLGILGQLSRLLLVRRLIPQLSLGWSRIEGGLVRGFVRLSVWFAVIDVAKAVRDELDVVVVGVILGVPAAGVYAVGQKASTLAGRLVQPAILTLFPYSAELEAQGDLAGLRAAVITGTRISLGVAGPLCVALAVLARPALHAWVGDGFGAAGGVVVLLSAAIALRSFAQSGVYVLQGRGDVKLPACAFATGAVINVAFSVLLGRRYGLRGVATGTLLADCAVSVGFITPFVCRRLGLPVLTLLREVMAAHALPAVAALLVGWGVLKLPLGGSWGTTLVGGALIALTYLALFSRTGLSQPERAILRTRLGNLRRAPTVPPPPAPPHDG